MMGPLSRSVLVSLASLGALSTPAAFAADASVPAAETARRQLAMRDAMQQLQEARLAYAARKYSAAVDHYRAALDALPQGPASQKQRTFISESLSDALIAKAIDYRSVGRTDEAVEFLREAIKLAPQNQRAEIELAHTQDPVRTNPALSPQHVGDVAEVSRLLTLAYGYMDLGQYDKAIETFNAVRRIDAYNTAATRGLEQAHKRRSSYFRTAHGAYRGKALAEASSGWDEAMSADTLPADLESSGAASELQGALDSELETSFADALSQMVMPQIIFEDATMAEVIETLQNQVLRFESSGVASARHINISANFGSQNSQGYKEIMEKRVSLNLSQVSVRDVLDILTNQLGISYYYTPVGVELTYSGKDFGPLVERSFTVPPHFFDGAGDDAADEDEEEDEFASASPRVSVRRVNPVQALKAMGISFPEGATARYAPSTRTLHVRNTAHNITEVQELLNVPMSEERQVILNVVVMQMSEKDLEELGFDWLVKVGLGGEQVMGGGVEQAASTAVGLPSISSVDSTTADYVTSGLRSGTEVINQSGMERLIETGSAQAFVDRKTQKAPGIFSLRGVWSTADVAVIMRGLSQKKGVDILQNPQLVFSPGMDEQVTFASVREIYYPEEYEQGEISSTSFNMPRSTGDMLANAALNGDVSSTYRVTATTATGSHPSEFVRYGMSEDGAGGIGTILQVHSAELTEDGRFLKLAMTTTVTDFEGFVNWGSPIQSVMVQPTTRLQQVARAVTGEDTSSTGFVRIELSPNYILKPIFKRHLVNNAITVAPGAVLVFAGLKEAKKIRYEDKVPVLGDLPLVGRFFRSEGEEDSRKVLIYFAKVDVVDPAGRDVRTGKRPGRMTESL